MTSLENSFGRGRKLGQWNSFQSGDNGNSFNDLPDLPQVKVATQFTFSDVSSRPPPSILTVPNSVTLTPPSSLSPGSASEGGGYEGGAGGGEEEEGDYDNVCSPCSSTASGPIVIRRPGFTHYAQHLPPGPAGHRQKKQKLNLVSIHQHHRADACRRREPTPPKGRTRRDPLPMRLRALPQSFFQQPNKPLNVEPTAAYPVLPPLFTSDTTDVRPVTPPGEREKRQQQQTMTSSRLPPDTRITVTNLDLLNKLFENIETDKAKGTADNSKTLGSIKRSRSNKHVIIATNNKSLLSGQDPYLVEAMTEKLFPQLGLEKGVAKGGGATVQLVSIKEGERTLMLPSLTVEQNLPHLLSELVTHF